MIDNGSIPRAKEELYAAWQQAELKENATHFRSYACRITKRKDNSEITLRGVIKIYNNETPEQCFLQIPVSVDENDPFHDISLQNSAVINSKKIDNEELQMLNLKFGPNLSKVGPNPVICSSSRKWGDILYIRFQRNTLDVKTMAALPGEQKAQIFAKKLSEAIDLELTPTL